MIRLLWYRKICANRHLYDDTLGRPTSVSELRAKFGFEDDTVPQDCYREIPCPTCGGHMCCHAPFVGFAGFKISHDQDGEPAHVEVDARALAVHLRVQPNKETFERYLRILRRSHKGVPYERKRRTPYTAVGMRFC